MNDFKVGDRVRVKTGVLPKGSYPPDNPLGLQGTIVRSSEWNAYDWAVQLDFRPNYSYLPTHVFSHELERL